MESHHTGRYASRRGRLSLSSHVERWSRQHAQRSPLRRKYAPSVTSLYSVAGSRIESNCWRWCIFHGNYSHLLYSIVHGRHATTALTIGQLSLGDVWVTAGCCHRTRSPMLGLRNYSCNYFPKTQLIWPRYTNVRDRQTDRQTDGRTVAVLCFALRASRGIALSCRAFSRRQLGRQHRQLHVMDEERCLSPFVPVFHCLETFTNAQSRWLQSLTSSIQCHLGLPLRLVANEELQYIRYLPLLCDKES